MSDSAILFTDDDSCCDDSDSLSLLNSVIPYDDFSDECCDNKELIIGPPGPPGSPGTQGPMGPVGPAGAPGAGGLQLVVTTSSSIAIGQLYTIVNASIDTNQTLPLISSVLLNNIAVPYTVYNYAGNRVTVLGSGGDLINGSSSALIQFQNESVTFLPSTLGWLVI